MRPQARLKIGAVFFAIIWITGMILWSGRFEPANVVILTACGCLGGYLWYLGMRWFFRGFGHPLDRG
jgi:hypothetical protein